MKSIVREWISNLIVVAILAALVDMILPSGKIRKYTEFLFGLVIIAIFLHPLFLLVGQSVNLEKVIFQNSTAQLNQSTSYFSNQAEKKQQERLEHFVKTNLERDLSLQIEHRTGLRIDHVNIKFDRLNGQIDYSSIQQIDIYVILQSKGINIDSVVINPNYDSYDNKDFEKHSIVREITKIVSELYDIKLDLVHVYID